MDPQNVPAVSCVGDDPFLRSSEPRQEAVGRWGQYSMSKFPAEVQFTDEQLRSMRSFYRPRHNDGGVADGGLRRLLPALARTQEKMDVSRHSDLE